MYNTLSPTSALLFIYPRGKNYDSFLVGKKLKKSLENIWKILTEFENHCSGIRFSVASIISVQVQYFTSHFILKLSYMLSKRAYYPLLPHCLTKRKIKNI